MLNREPKDKVIATQQKLNQGTVVGITNKTLRRTHFENKKGGN